MRSIFTATGSMVLALALGAPATAMAQQRPDPPPTSQLAPMRVDQLTGKSVINDTGDEVGKVKDIVRDKTSGQVAAVVGIGGFLGIGEHDVTISLQDLSMRGDRLQAPAGTTKDKLEKMPQYDDSKYEKVSGDQKITVGNTTRNRPM